jgi:Sulfotransferase domain
MNAENQAVGQFLPNLFILGAAKCGTSTLYDYLAPVPQICLSKLKEPNFFECQLEKGLAYYQDSYFPHWQGEQYVGDARCGNLYLPCVAERIHRINPNARLIAILRNPIERAYSHWWWCFQRNDVSHTFEAGIREDYERIQRGEFVDTPEMIAKYCENFRPGYALHRTYLETGHYAEQIERYLKLFRREQLKVVFLEDMHRDPLKLLQDIQDFLGIQYFTEETLRPVVSNEAQSKIEARMNILARFAAISHRLKIVSLIPKPLLEVSRKIRYRITSRPTLSKSMRQWLYDYYVPHNQRLEQLLGIDVSHWK